MLVYGTTVENVSVTIYLWLSVIPFISYLLNGIFWGFALTTFYFGILSITFLNHFDNYAHQITIESSFNLLTSVTVLWILTHSYAVSNLIANKKLFNMAMKDSLTKLNNRHAFYEFFKQNKDKTKSLLIIDLDFFKKVNDNYGHDAGDCILQTVAELFHQHVSNKDCVFRLGGEEFAILLPNTELTEASKIAEKINETIKKYEFLYHNQSIKITVSIGVTYSRSSDDNLNTLMRQADTCLYYAKNNGRDCVVIDKNTLS
ncbi:MAG: GGDEF domain-containing protein [Moraxellaceae bacterium]|nr:GGDEF domain-containing protein [Moraxellaceae bacterium]